MMMMPRRCKCGRWAEGRHGPGENVCREEDAEIIACAACGWPEHRTRTRSVNAWGARVCADCWEDGIRRALTARSVYMLRREEA